MIAHLPETTSWGDTAAGLDNQHGGVRNELITGFYNLLAHRADALFAGDLAGSPTSPATRAPTGCSSRRGRPTPSAG